MEPAGRGTGRAVGRSTAHLGAGAAGAASRYRGVAAGRGFVGENAVGDGVGKHTLSPFWNGASRCVAGKPHGLGSQVGWGGGPPNLVSGPKP